MYNTEEELKNIAESLGMPNGEIQDLLDAADWVLLHYNAFTDDFVSEVERWLINRGNLNENAK